MPRITHAAQIDFRFSDPAREFLDFGVGVCPGDFARELFHFFAHEPTAQMRGLVLAQNPRRVALARGETRFATG